MKKDILLAWKESRGFRAFTIFFVATIILVGGVLTYSIKSQEYLTVDQSNNNGGGNLGGQTENNFAQDQNKEVIIDGEKVSADQAFPRGVIDGVIMEIDASYEKIVLRADISKIYPKSPVKERDITVLVKNAKILISEEGKERPSANSTDLEVGRGASVALVDEQSNRDIMNRNEFSAKVIMVFR